MDCSQQSGKLYLLPFPLLQTPCHQIVIPLLCIYDRFLLSLNNFPWQIPYAVLFLIWISELAYHLVVHLLFYTLFPFHSFSVAITLPDVGLSSSLVLQSLLAVQKVESKARSPNSLVLALLWAAPTPIVYTMLHPNQTIHCSLHVPSNKNHFSFFILLPLLTMHSNSLSPKYQILSFYSDPFFSSSSTFVNTLCPIFPIGSHLSL